MIIDSTYDIEKLQGLLEENIIKFGPKKRFIHPRTVSNFLFHFFSFKDKRKKQHIYNNLKELLETLLNIEFEDLTPQVSANLFNQYINPIVNYYDVYRSFSVHIKGGIFFIIAVVAIGIITISNFSIYYDLIVIILLATLYAYNRYKEKLNKTYGNFY